MKQKNNNFSLTLRLVVYRKMSDALNEVYEQLTSHPGNEIKFQWDIEALQGLASNLIGYLGIAVLDQKEKVIDLDVEFPWSFLIETVNTIAGKKDVKDFLPLLENARKDFVEKVKDTEDALSPEDQEELDRLTFLMKSMGILSSIEDDENIDYDDDESFLNSMLSRIRGTVVIMNHSSDDDDDDEDED